MDQTRSDISEAIVLACHRLYAKGLVTATDGNVSARLPNGNVLITPSAVNKGDVRARLLVELRPDGTPVTLDRKASTEAGMHLAIYRERPDVHGVVHAHPPYATGFATARVPLTPNIFPEVIIGLGDIPLAPYATPSTPDVGTSLIPFLRTSDAILLTNHGAVTFGATVEEAYYKMEKVEHAAHITFVARLLGGERPLDPRDVERLRSLSATVYGKAPRQTSEPRGNQADVSEEDVKKLIRTVLTESGRRDA
ncbi:MAG: aldolase [Bacteroidia bacterium]|nr:MAG: aldolase [Bacteroidia bacterium]